MIEFDETYVRDNDLRRAWAVRSRNQKLPPEMQEQVDIYQGVVDLLFPEEPPIGNLSEPHG